MTDDHIAAQWANASQRVLIQNLARRLVTLKLSEGYARTQHQEALLYYQSQHWLSDGIAAETLDGVLKQLATDHEAAKTLRAAVQDELDAKLQSSALPGQPSLTLRREEAIADATSYVHATYELPTQPSLLNSVIAQHRSAKALPPNTEPPSPTPKQSPPKRRRR